MTDNSSPVFTPPPQGGWRSERRGALRIHSAGAPEGLSALLQALERAPDAAGAARALAGVSGVFALVIEGPDWLLAAVDRIRSIPLIWRRDAAGRIALAQTAATLGEGPLTPDPEQTLATARAGYTVGRGTLFREVTGLIAGELLLVGPDGAAQQAAYHRYRPWRAPFEATRDEAAARRDLAELTLDILRETIVKADGRPIALPLSAGLDSRLIASGLRHLGHENVICFAYGRPGNREALASERIAQRLGYPWRFAPYDNLTMHWAFRRPDYAAFRAYSDSLTGVHFAQDFPALSFLLARGLLPKDCLVVNGQSGDFLTGNHIPDSLLADGARGLDERARAAVLEALRLKHFKQWGFLETEAANRRVDALLSAQVDALMAGEDAEEAAPFGVYEAVEFHDRQSKYVVNGQRAYEALGLAWDLPLWRERYIDYWEAAPRAWKARQRLYREMLEEADWGRVWRDIPVNRLRVRPGWMRPVRFFFKALHAPLGRAAWRRFERRYLDYFTSPLCGYALRPWRAVAFDRREPMTALSPHIEDYLDAHGIALTALAEERAA